MAPRNWTLCGGVSSGRACFLFLDPEPLDAPFRGCGLDLDSGALSCERYEPCE